MAVKQTKAVELVEQLYGAYNRGDIEAVVAMMADDITWIEPEGHPLAGTQHGPDDILEHTFGELQKNLAAGEIVTDRYVDGGDTVVALGTARLTAKDGTTYTPDFAHVWEFEDDKVQKFTNYTDTVLVREAFGT